MRFKRSASRHHATRCGSALSFLLPKIVSWPLFRQLMGSSTGMTQSPPCGRRQTGSTQPSERSSTSSAPNASERGRGRDRDRHRESIQGAYALLPPAPMLQLPRLFRDMRDVEEEIESITRGTGNLQQVCLEALQLVSMSVSMSMSMWMSMSM